MPSRTFTDGQRQAPSNAEKATCIMAENLGANSEGTLRGPNRKTEQWGSHNLLPATGDVGHIAGAQFHDMTLRRTFTNVGDTDNSLFTDFFTNRYALTERFELLPQLNAVRDAAAAYSQSGIQALVNANPHFEAIGTNMTSALADRGTYGGVKLSTAGASADQAILQVHANANSDSQKVSAWNSAIWSTSAECLFEALIYTPATITQATFFAGLKLTNTPVVATDSDQAFLRGASTTAANYWHTVDSAGGTDNDQTSTVLVTASSLHHLMIRVDADRVPYYYVNGVYLMTGSALAASVALYPFVGVHATEAVAKSVEVLALRLSRAA